MQRIVSVRRVTSRILSRQYTAPLTDMRYLINDVLHFPQHYESLGLDPDVCGKDTIDAIISESAKFAESVLAPLNDISDREGTFLNILYCQCNMKRY
jgi:hypothetical protein